MNSTLSGKRHELLALLQTAFPIENRPFQVLADRLHIRESEVIDMTRSLIRGRVIREIGPIFEARGLGYVSTLVAARVGEERIAGFAAAMLAIGEITHCYSRDNEFNLWFTITARDRDYLEEILRWAGGFEGVQKVLELPMEQVFKISAVFGAEALPLRTAREDIPVPVPDEAGKAVIRSLQNGLPVVEQPFLALSEELGLAESFLLQRIRRWMESGIIRRFGARLDHNRAGYAINTLVAWDGDQIQSWGKQFAEISRVSHCYVRKFYPEWPYRLYTMVHARTGGEMDATLNAMRHIASGARVAVLPTRNELKKTSMKYFLEK
ncbi:MAG: siroheme decarboxylase subunit beta [Candidatus Latescibacterota bacterium]